MPDLKYPLPEHPDPNGFNHRASIPFGLQGEHVYRAMRDFTDFLEFVDAQLSGRGMIRIEEMLMPANFSSMVGEFMTATIPKYCSGVVKNTYHNGHPDLLPQGKYSRNSSQHAGADGIEVKASRYLKSWQGHNAENVWLMVFIFQAGRPTDASKKIAPVKFRFLSVLGALLLEEDWKFAGRGEESRRTITASVTKSGYDKMKENWIYRAPKLLPEFEPQLISLDGH